MIDLEFIERLIRVFDNSGVDSLEIERTGTRISLSKTPPYGGATFPGISAPAPVLAGAASDDAQVVTHLGEEERATASNLIEVTSPMV